ncbi:DUF4873 domain-containing protein [Nocardia sp. NPDC051570]|uniref:DUF4873 domain-containing protein n=1 Tax=Nocardia sp. NPDC051570 TaxID=3364324 RepID=UPI0037915C81
MRFALRHGTRPSGGDVDVAVIGTGADELRAARELGRDGIVGCYSPVTALEFDDAADRWTVRSARGEFAPRIVVLTPPADLAEWTLIGLGGRTIAQARGTSALLGIALHGFPNLFFLTPPPLSDTAMPPAALAARIGYIRRCVDLLRRTSCTRIEARAATQHEFDRRLRADSRYRPAPRRPAQHHFDLTVAADREPAQEYSGPALLDAPGAELLVSVALSGHPDPIDGRYHWYGRIAGADGGELPDPGRGQVFLTLPGGHPAPGRLQERDPWGNLRIVGVGEPPFPLEPAPAH